MFESVLFKRLFLVILAIVLGSSLAMYFLSVPRIRGVIYGLEEESSKTILDNVCELVRTEALAIEAYKKSAGEAHKRELKNIILLGESFVESQYNQYLEGFITKEEAQKIALDEMAKFRYGNNDYIFIVDSDSLTLSHANPDIIGRDMSVFKDAEGVALVPEMVKIALAEKEGGYTEYLWPKLEGEEPVKKLSFSHHFEPWGWILGTGVYIDDIEAEVKRRKEEMIGELRETIDHIKIAGSGYVFIFDSEKNLIVHPNPELEGTSVARLLNPVTQEPLIDELIAASKTADHKLFYLWDKPGDRGRYEYEKIAWVKYVKDFDWYIVTSVYTDELNHSTAILRNRILSVSGAVLLVSITVAWLLFGKFLAPVRKLSDMAEKVTQGDLSARCEVRGKDELGMLASTFNTMVDQLNYYIHDLDRKVRDRTVELNEKNEFLEREIDERLRIEAELRAAKDEAEAADRAKSDFLARMSHEIRTPMNAILGMAELLQETDLSTEQEDYVETFSSSGELLLGIINDVLDFSKIEAGQIELENIPFDLREVVEDTCKIMSFRAHEKGMELACHLNGDVAVSRSGDPTRLKQILVNLLGNAIKFTHQGEVFLSVVEDPDLEDGVAFTVRDTGVGIPAEKMDLIFDSFSQADSSTTREFGGTGLGLAISKALVELMGGGIQVESEVGLGTAFLFSLKIEKGVPTPKTYSAALSSLQGLRVLVVDDNATNRMIFSEHLSRWGAEVTECESGREALDAVSRAIEAQKPYQLAMIDCNMPKMDGNKLIEQLKLTGTAPKCLMMFSSSDSTEQKALARQMGVTQHLVKPIKQSEMLAAIRNALGKAGIGTEKIKVPVKSWEDGLPGLRILLAEDYQPNRKIVESFLKKTDVVIESAENGLVALEKYKAGRFDMVLMDMEMPVMDGLEATRRIRDWEKENDRPRTPLVALTAHVFSEHRKECVDVGCTDFLPKPIKKKTLFEAIWKVVREEGHKLAEMPASKEAAPTSKVRKKKTHTVVVDDDLSEVIGEYLKAIGQDIDRLSQSLKKRDWEDIHQVGHDLKGSGGGYGLDRVTRIGQTLSDLASKNDPAGIREQITELKEYLENLHVVSAEAYTVRVEEELAHVIDDYIRAVKQDCRTLVKAVRKKDFESIYGIGHDLKGSGGGYGLDVITEIGQSICRHTRNKDLPRVVEQVKRLTDYVQNVIIVRS